MDALPAHQRPPMRELGRRSEAADHPFRAMPPDEGGGRSVTMVPIPVLTPMRPLVASHRVGSRVEIAAACPTALALGLRPGMALAQARAQVPDLDVRPADPAGDLAELTRMALFAARRWSPIVALSGSDGLFIDLTGLTPLMGGEARLARRILRLLDRRGIAACIAVADTPGAAWALARTVPAAHHRLVPVICPPGQHSARLAPLPIAALRIDGRPLELLHRLGVERIADLTAMPRAALVRRVGTTVARRIDQALGHLPEPLDPVVPMAPVMVEQRFAEPIATAEAIAHWLGRLMPALATALEAAGHGARMVELVADRVDGVAQHIRIGLARASRDPAHLLRLTARRIETIEPGFGIDRLALHVRRSEPLGPQAIGETLGQDVPVDLAPLVDAIANRIGTTRIWRVCPVDSDVPERSVAASPPLDPLVASADRLRVDDVRRLDRSDADHPWHPRWPRPVRLLRRPEPVDHVMAELPDLPPRRFTWRGQTYLIVRADGPERIQGEWWRRRGEADAIRDYFHVEDDAGRRFWLFRRGDGMRTETGDLSWFLHGWFG